MSRKPQSEVYAVKDLDDVKTITKFLERHYGEMYSDIWLFGINTALRISDILSIRYDDIDSDYSLRIKERKTGKKQDVILPSRIRAIVDRRRTSNPDDTYLFQSHSRNVKGIKPITQAPIYLALTEAGRVVGIKMGTHSMRKTFGYHRYKQTNDIGMVMEILNHSSQSQTLRYIGITKETKSQALEEINLG